MVVPPGYRLNATIGTTVAASYHVSAMDTERPREPSGTVISRIKVDHVVMAENTSSDGYSIASRSGRS